MSQPLPTDALSLVADIGGTNTRVAMAQAGVIMSQSIRRFANADYSAPEAVLSAYLRDHAGPAPEGAAVAIAGTVLDGVADMTNLGWSLSEADLAALSGARRVRVLNDLQAQGHALDHLAPGSLSPVLPGRRAPAQAAAQANHQATHRATRLVIGLGTGFNACAVFHTDRGVFVPPAEAGHCLLALSGDQAALLGHDLAPMGAPPRIEKLLSGPGLARIHARLAPKRPPLSPAEVTQAAGGGDAAARQAMALFVRLLGRVSADLALLHLPFGGIFLVGGVSRAIAPFLKPLAFEESFHERSRFMALIKDFPVTLVGDDYAALRGCARVLLA